MASVVGRQSKIVQFRCNRCFRDAPNLANQQVPYENIPESRNGTMKYLDHTCGAGAENLAWDEALLEWCEKTDNDEVLRFYEPQSYFVVLGYGNHARRETRFDACRSAGIPILRRCSGGGTVLQGPGCLNYALILRADSSETASIPAANRYIMERNRGLLQSMLLGEVHMQGHTDLTWNGRKFSGNAQRRKRRFFLFHGTILHRFDLAAVDRWLARPSVEPDYRQGRTHADFLTNVPVAVEVLKSGLRESWGATDILTHVPDWKELMKERYGREEWNLRF